MKVDFSNPTIAIFFEASGIVRDAFIEKGLNAVSVDLRETEQPGPHIIGNVFNYLDLPWSGAIMHPDCTFLASSGLHWNRRVYGREASTLRSIHLVKQLMKAPYPFAIENPRGRISTAIREPSQSIQPYQFGEDASKETFLWLQGLPLLKRTRRFDGRTVIDPRTEKIVERWSNQTDSGQNNLSQSEDRWALRSKTYPGIAEAFADQWAQSFLDYAEKGSNSLSESIVGKKGQLLMRL